MKFIKYALLVLLVLAVAMTMIACGTGDPTVTTGSSASTTASKPTGSQPSNPGGNNPGGTEDNTPGALKAEKINDSECAITGHTGKYEGTLTIPETYEIDGVTYTVTEIGASAFANCKAVTAIVVPDSVRTIGKGAFAGCNAVTSVTLPFVGGSAESNTYIGYIFGGSSFAANATVVPETLATVTLSDACLNISAFAFDSCEGIETVNFGSSITGIGGYAFAHCAITNPVLPDSLTSVGIGAFADCPVESMVLPFVGESEGGASGHIGYLFGATDYASNIDFVPSTLTSVEITSACETIGAGAFNDCTALTNITLPDTIIAIGRDAFTNTPYYNAMEDGLVYVGKVVYGFKGEMTNTDITLRNDTIAIAAGAFDGLEITSITIPETVTNIGAGALRGSKIASLTLSFVGGSADAPSSSNFVGYIFGATSATQNATYVPATLKTVVLRDNCTRIADSAFLGCADITSVTLGTGVESLAKNAFFGCTKLATLSVAAGNETYKNNDGLVYNAAGDDLVAVPLGLTGNVTLLDIKEIGDSQFRDCAGMTGIVLPATLESIGDYAFAGATSLATINFDSPTDLNAVGYAALLDTAWFGAQPDGNVYTGSVLYRFKGTSAEGAVVTIDSTVKGIAAGAFENCSISSVVIPSNVEIIGEGAFKGCEVVSMTLPYIGASAAADEVNNFVGYLFGAPSATLAPSYIPASLTSVTLLDGCTYIGAAAFSGCTNVSEIVFPDSVTWMEADALVGTAWLKTAQEAPGVLYAGRVVYGFNGYGAGVATVADDEEEITDVFDVTLREGTVAIVDGAFKNTGITKIRMPDSLLRIGANAFEGCSALSYVNMSSGLTSIGRRAFYSCTALEEIYIPGAVRELPSQVLARCRKLKTLIIGYEITLIGENALQNADALEQIRIVGNKKTWEENCTIDDSNTVFGFSSLKITGGYNYVKEEH